MDLSDIPKIRGPLKYVGYIGVLVMMGGLAAFAFGLLSLFANIDPDNIPKGFPPIAIYGFGVAAVGAILVTIALGLGDKDDDVNIYTGPVFGDYTDVKGPIITGTHGPVIAPTYNVIYDQRTYVDQIARSLRRLPPGPTRRRAEAAVRDVHDAVEGQDPEDIADALGNLTNILNKAGALAVAGNAAAQGIINLAGTLGAAGQGLLHWFGVA